MWEKQVLQNRYFVWEKQVLQNRYFVWQKQVLQNRYRQENPLAASSNPGDFVDWNYTSPAFCSRSILRVMRSWQTAIANSLAFATSSATRSASSLFIRRSTRPPGRMRFCTITFGVGSQITSQVSTQSLSHSVAATKLNSRCCSLRLAKLRQSLPEGIPGKAYIHRSSSCFDAVHCRTLTER